MRYYWPLVLLLLLNPLGSSCLAWQALVAGYNTKGLPPVLVGLTRSGPAYREEWPYQINQMRLEAATCTRTRQGHQGEQRPKTVLEFARAQREAIEQFALSYNEEGRADTLYTPDHTYCYHYNADGELTSIAGGEQPIHFSDCDEHGKSQSIAISSSNKKATGKAPNNTLWDQIKATQEVWPGTVIPRSFYLNTQRGTRVWVHGNATEHLAERVVNMNERLLTPDLVRIGQQVHLTSLLKAVNAVTRNGVPLVQIVRDGGWELEFRRQVIQATDPPRFMLCL